MENVLPPTTASVPTGGQTYIVPHPCAIQWPVVPGMESASLPTSASATLGFLEIPARSLLALPSASTEVIALMENANARQAGEAWTAPHPKVPLPTLPS